MPSEHVPHWKTSVCLTMEHVNESYLLGAPPFFYCAEDCPACEADRRHANAVRVLRAASNRSCGRRWWDLGGGHVLFNGSYESLAPRFWINTIHSSSWGYGITRDMARALLGLVPGVQK